MNIMIYLDSQLRSEAIYRLLTRSRCDRLVVSGRSHADGFTPDVLLVDITMLTHDLLARYPQAKAFLIDDAGIQPERLCAALLSYTMHGILTLHAGLQQVWIENGSVKALRHDAGAIPKAGRRKQFGRLPRVAQQTALRLTLPQRTVKVHPNTTFKSSRSPTGES